MAGKPHKLNFKKLVKLCKRDFKGLKLTFDMLSEEDKVLKILSIVLHKIYEKNSQNNESMKFSDYLIAEPYLDYHLFKICKEIDYTGAIADTKMKRTPFNKKFGIFDVEKLQKKKNLKVAPQPITEKEFKEKLK